MATWQYSLHIAPRRRVEDFVARHVPIPEERLDDACSWEDDDVPGDYEEVLSGFLKRIDGWSPHVKAWGAYDGHCIKLMVEDRRVLEVSVRVHVSDANPALLENIVSFARHLGGWLIVEDRTVVEPDVRLLAQAIRQSPAARFVTNPEAFLSELGARMDRDSQPPS